MKGLSRIILLTVLVAAAAFLGCSQDDVGYTAYAPKDHAVYTIARKGAWVSDENFNVVLVYGFNDNREIARQISDFLNQEEPNTYFFFEGD